VPRHLTTTPATWLKGLAPSRAGRVGAVDCRFPGDWPAALWTHEGLPCALGQAPYLTALPGGQATTDPSAAHPMAVRRRGGLRPQAAAYRAARRATRAHPAGPPRLGSAEHNPGQGQAVPLFAPHVWRAVDDRVPRAGACARPSCLHDAGRGVGERDASRAHQGRHLRWTRREQAARTASVNAEARLGHAPRARGVMRPLRPLLLRGREWPPGEVCGASPAPDAHGSTVTVAPVMGRGRDEGTGTFLGRRAHLGQSLPPSRARRSPLKTCVVPPRVRCTRVRSGHMGHR
jgi:hypothetical protein